MGGSSCVVCKRTRVKGVSLHRFPSLSSQPARRRQWLTGLGLEEEQMLDHHRVCSLHFPNGDVSQVPSITLGRRFASPIKKNDPRGLRAQKRARPRPSPLSLSETTPGTKRHSVDIDRIAAASDPTVQPAVTTARVLSTSSTAATSSGQDSAPDEAPLPSVAYNDDCLAALPLIAAAGETLLSAADYSVYELPVIDDDRGDHHQQSESQVLVDNCLMARIEALEAENEMLRKQVSSSNSFFRLENIAHDNSLVHFYTGFQSYEVLLAFYDFLGPAVDDLIYWGSKSSSTCARRRMKLDPMNQLFLTLIKLKLNLKEVDIAHRFGVSVASVSRYFITWICFLYFHLKEIDWMPTVDQVKATLPHAFREKYLTTYIIIDGSEIFIETSNDLQHQSSTWSNYKHHNTAKFLIGCTPNGAVSFVSSLYVGSISDVELTRESGLIQALEGKPNISVMADRGFTIRDQLKAVNVELNIPPFMDGQVQLPTDKVLEGRKIASVRVHVERVIGRIKNFSILKGTLPITLSRTANQIVSVCCLLLNFQPVLIPPPTDSEDSDVDNYFKLYYSSNSDYDADSESSDCEN